ncbi:lytic polysaccharide monooxygenase auxiliary activity family 9 protein [Streptomyces tsukubensis]|uniref:Chitin-binding protein n=1 Tax=Streptomyces tsukubensis TaxID=83656 RepID=A0A1V4AFI2_9ACTN|nr:lytic polysaccharide monooxygenase [Streptomyces tsukubensis]OON82351.1 chitin-binding protein [Streptomyces tsukubensis]QFR92846.1 chitin-binding protein [Streptomyces tsukubensis]
MTARPRTARRIAGSAVAGLVPLALVTLAASPASAHGSLADPVSRVSACYAEGPESPTSAACEAAVAAGGSQALYDWNAVNIADAAGNHRGLVPDGKLCGAGNSKYRGLDLPRADWPASELSAGRHTFRFKATAPHKGAFELYMTKQGYDPAKPLNWSDLEAKPFVKVTDPTLTDGEYVFDGIVPRRTGRQLIYTVWQRSDSPEAFYACSDVVFGKDTTGAGPAASAPSDKEIAAGTAHSTVEHGGHGDADAGTRAKAQGGSASDAVDSTDSDAGTPSGAAGSAEHTAGANHPEVKGAAESPAAGRERLAETGGDSTTAYLVMAGAGAVAIGGCVLITSARRRAGTGTRGR